MFVQEFGRREGYPPSLREIATEVGLVISTVSYHLSLMEREGSVRGGAGQPRTITGPADHSSRPDGDKVKVPLVGQIAAGIPVDAVEAAEETFLLSRGWSATGPCHAAGQGRLDGRRGDHRRGPGSRPPAAGSGERRDRGRPAAVLRREHVWDVGRMRGLPCLIRLTWA